MSHQVRLNDDIYERIKAKKRAEETFSEAIDRLTSEWTLDDFAEGASVVDPESHRELLAQVDRQNIEDTSELLEEIGIEIEEQ